MKDRFSFTYLDHPVTAALLVTREKSRCLVYASLGSSQQELLGKAKLDFQKLSKRTKITYDLHYDTRDSMVHLKRVFASYLDGSTAESISYEYIFGTKFQRKVWDELLKVNMGDTTTYGAIASAIGSPRASRAVGTAVGANKIAVVVPCHRCKPCDGSLGNFRWGTQLKDQLL